MKLCEIRLSVPLFVKLRDNIWLDSGVYTAPCLSPPGNAGQVHLTLFRPIHRHMVADHD
ncbi:hypothetical protein ACRRTK_016917 [Alexandromys fortis]